MTFVKSRLYCTLIMFQVVSNTCSKLQVLNVSQSSSVTDLGLVYLCACKYLREIYFDNHHHHSGHRVLPKVVSCLLQHLNYLEVIDVASLEEGIEFYLNAGDDDHHEDTLKLVHYTGSDRLSADILRICPKLRTFKLFVTDDLPHLGSTLANVANSLDQITLVYDDDRDLGADLDAFLARCGAKIASLQIIGRRLKFRPEDLIRVSDHCKFLDVLRIPHFKFVLSDGEAELERLRERPLNLPFTTEIRLGDVVIENKGKEAFKWLLGGCPDLEKLFLSFPSSAYYFSDFLLDDILNVNPLGRLEQFSLQEGSLTLISALRLISSRPKLRIIGRLLTWDVESSELETFTNILRHANSLKLLQNIKIY